MPRVLVVEDSPDQALIITALLEAHGFDTDTARNGKEALESVGADVPDVVVTDLIMPEMNGLVLVETLRRDHPRLPVILMTAYGSGEIAARALRSGAASYVPKRSLREELIETVENTFALAQTRREHLRMLLQLTESESRFVLGNDPSLVSPLVGHVQATIAERIEDVDQNQLMQLGVALQEAMLNAMHHGNLEVDSSLRDDSFAAFQRQIELRRTQPPYRDRLIQLAAKIEGTKLTCVVRDEGNGFDPKSVPDPTSADNLLRTHGRGLYLIGTFMDEVAFNDTGNCITMFKQLSTEKTEVPDDG